MNWDFIVLVGTMMFWALLHVWSPDGRQWRHDIADPEESGPTPAVDGDVAPAPRPRQ